MNMWEYRKKRVRITDTDGTIHVGYADFYTSALDAPDGIPTLSFVPDGRDDIFISFEESEIADIEVISANTSAITIPA